MGEELLNIKKKLKMSTPCGVKIISIRTFLPLDININMVKIKFTRNACAQKHK
jgi:hypothetical protein